MDIFVEKEDWLSEKSPCWLDLLRAGSLPEIGGRGKTIPAAAIAPPSHISRRLGSSPTVILDYPPPQHRPFRYGRSMQVEGMEGWQISGRMNQILQGNHHQNGT